MMFWLFMLMLAPAPDVSPSVPPAASASVKDRYSTVAFDPTADAQRQLASRLDHAKVANRKLLVIMGANWCHDSGALANVIESRRFAEVIAENYELLFVDVGVPQTGNGRNLDIAKRFGIKKVKGTPLVMVISPDGKLLNSKKDAAGWRNAASRSEDDIFRYFAEFKPSAS